MHTPHGLRRHTGLAVTIAALLVVALVGTTLEMDEIGETDLEAWLALASTADLSTDVRVPDPSLVQNVRNHDRHQERIALERSLKC